MCEGRDRRIDKIPRAGLPESALLTDHNSAIRDLLNQFSQVLSVAGLPPAELTRTRLQCSGVPDNHYVSAARPDVFQEEPCDVVHALVKLEVCLVWLQVLHGNHGNICGIHLEPELYDVVVLHEGGYLPAAPRQPLKQSLLHLYLSIEVSHPLQYGIGRLNASQGGRSEHVMYLYTLFPHPLPCEAGLEQPGLSYRRVFDEVLGAPTSLWELFGHVQVPPVIVALRVKGELYPLLAKRHVHPLGVTKYEESSRALWHGGWALYFGAGGSGRLVRGSFLFGFDFGVEFFDVFPLRKETYGKYDDIVCLLMVSLTD